MGERRGTKALELWCRRITDGYPGVNVQNMTTSWRDGLAFCAMIHHFRPDLIDFSSLNKDDVYRNNELAFRTAEQELGIPALLDAEDMASCAVPDRLSILTYLSQFYQVFGGSSPSRLALNRTSSESSSERISSVPESPQPKVSSRLGMRRERCASCGEPVFLAEKLVVSRSVYHRSCFRCARCHHQLTPGNYYETEDGQYCCEACPIDDLEPPPPPPERDLDLDPPAPLPSTPAPQLTSQRELPDHDQRLQHPQLQVESCSEAALLEAPLSDEEKSKRRSLERQRLQLQQEQQQSTAAAAAAAAAADLGKSVTSPDEHDHEFDQMLKLINDRIDQLTTSSDEPAAALAEQPPPPLVIPEASPPSPPAARRARDSRVHSAPDVVAHSSKTTDSQQPEQHSTETQLQTSLRRSSSLRLVSDTTHTKDQQPIVASPLRRLSLEPRERPSFEQPKPADDDDDKLKQQQLEQQQKEEEQTEKGEDAEGRQEEEKKAADQDDYPDDLNPFASGDEQEETKAKAPPVSTNPFGSDDDEEEQELPPKPMARTKSKRRILEAPQINLNPFWSEDEEPESETELRGGKLPPVPRPRTLRHSSHAEGMTSATLPAKSNLTISSIHSSNTSIASSCSTLTPGGTYRKKKPAPAPPIPAALTTPPRSLDGHSNSNSLSPRLTPRTRKSKPAPPPPPSAAASTPNSDRYSTSALPESEPELARLREKETTTEAPWQSGDNDKLSKDEANRNTRSLSCTENTLLYSGHIDKSLEGKWKRKKGPAPPRPMPLRRKIKVMSMKDVKLELDQIEMQQQGLERQGVRLEQIIRDKCESGTASEEASLGLDVEELVLELFALVNEKNELFRRQAELMLLRRQQRLEEEHADIEYQVRCLITQPEATKTDFDKQREETLIQRLVEIVEKRNEIVECLEMDRRREIEEDRSIHREMDLYAARNKAENVNLTDESRRSTLKFKKGKVKDKVKEKKSKKSSKKDADKDVDETEAKLKRHTLRKWF